MPPWQSQSVWDQIELFFRKSCRNASEFVEAEYHASEIARKLKTADDIFQDLCLQTCTSCPDLCCARATIWYDFNDLLFLYLQTKTLPNQQIIRKKNQDCPQLTANGCRLERLLRPFICTWYLCPEQTSRIAEISNTIQHDLSGLLLQIKEERKLMEFAFLNSVA